VSEVLAESLWNKRSTLQRLSEAVGALGDGPVSPPVARAYQRQKHLSRDEQAQVAERYLAGENVSELARAFGCHRDAIRRALDRLGVERRDNRTPKVNVEKARQLYESGLTAAQIAAEFGVSPTAVLNHLRSAGVVIRPRGKVAR